MPERDGLVARIRQLRSSSPSPSAATQPATGASQRDEVRALEARIGHLEELVQGLQDSVHRESTRLSKRIGELEARIHPAALGKALSDDARQRGL